MPTGATGCHRRGHRTCRMPDRSWCRIGREVAAERCSSARSPTLAKTTAQRPPRRCSAGCGSCRGDTGPRVRLGDEKAPGTTTTMDGLTFGVRQAKASATGRLSRTMTLGVSGELGSLAVCPREASLGLHRGKHSPRNLRTWQCPEHPSRARGNAFPAEAPALRACPFGVSRHRNLNQALNQALTVGVNSEWPKAIEHWFYGAELFDRFPAGTEPDTFIHGLPLASLRDPAPNVEKSLSVANNTWTKPRQSRGSPRRSFKLFCIV